MFEFSKQDLGSVLEAALGHKPQGSKKRKFQRLYDIRDRHARELDLPPNTVVANKELFALAKGTMDASAITGNRRIPADRLDRIREEMARR